MATYARSTRVAAPLDTVWAFHDDVDGLLALSPDWAGLRVESVRGPDGTVAPDDLGPGTEITLSARPLGLGPRQTVTTVITDRRVGNGSAMFRDELRDGPLARWVHTHAFYGDGEETVLRDRVEYATGLGAAADAAVRPALNAAFADRHRRTRRLLEAD